ncbi:MAG: hypothetical protein HXL60_07160 [Solobacterium sp.]|nr:hypothetical protein [Solobacterium sp.]
MDKKIIAGIVGGVGAVIGAVLFNKKRHGDDFDESDIARDEYGEIEDSEETEEK